MAWSLRDALSHRWLSVAALVFLCVPALVSAGTSPTCTGPVAAAFLENVALAMPFHTFNADCTGTDNEGGRSMPMRWELRGSEVCFDENGEKNVCFSVELLERIAEQASADLPEGGNPALDGDVSDGSFNDEAAAAPNDTSEADQTSSEPAAEEQASDEGASDQTTDQADAPQDGGNESAEGGDTPVDESGDVGAGDEPAGESNSGAGDENSEVADEDTPNER